MMLEINQTAEQVHQQNIFTIIYDGKCRIVTNCIKFLSEMQKYEWYECVRFQAAGTTVWDGLQKWI